MRQVLPTVMVGATALLMSTVSAAYKMRIGLLSDIHLDPDYKDGCNFVVCHDRGDYGTDTPQVLLDTMLEDMHLSYHDQDVNENSTNKIDVIMVTGDFVVHGLASKNFSDNNWEKQKPIIQTTFQTIADKFPGVRIINAIGNNDAIHHYQAPNGTVKTQFYGDLFDMWFTNYAPNTANLTKSQLHDIETTFKAGGYYRYDLNDEVTVLVLNTNYMSPRNEMDTE